MLAKDYDVTLAVSGSEAIEMFGAGRRFDVVLCDLMMPGATGIDVHAYLEANAPSQASRTVFMTGGAFTDAAQQFLLRPAIRWIEKPFVMRDLRAMITNVVEHHERHASGERAWESRVTDAAVESSDRQAPP